MKKSLFHKSTILLPALMILLGFASSCNEKTDNPEEEIAVTISTVAVKDFTLKADSKILSNLDSVFFSIDLKNGVIFNADSLPKGTDISRLIPVITFTTTMSEADLVISDTDGSTIKTINYLETTTDSVDFTKNVTLKVTAYDKETKYTYRLKVNVHEQKPDSLMWDDMGVGKLPSRMDAPRQQKSISYPANSVADAKTYTVIEEKDGTFTLATSSDMAHNVWEKQQLNLAFTPRISSLAVSSDAFWMLAEDGTLYTSTDCSSWTSTGEKWDAIIGGYMNAVLGVKDGFTMHCHYPASVQIADTPVDPEFPREGFTSFKEVYSKWATEPTGFILGGVKPDGTYSNAVWAYDGTSWAAINNAPAPALYGASIIKYTSYRNLGSIFHQEDYDVWMIIGGKFADGTYNRNIYISGDNGIIWNIGSELTELPDYVPSLAGADAIVAESQLHANLNDYWNEMPGKDAGLWLKPAFTLDGYDLTWKCPYIYLVGGVTQENRLSDAIWRGVLTRLTFTPLI